jgi:predicted ATPase/DNA-binding SARP family transcriptional activator
VVKWKLQLFGRPALVGKEQKIVHFPTQQVVLLLAYLATHNQQNTSREQLTELLWQDVEPNAGRNRFKQTLSSLRRLLESGEQSTSSLLWADRMHVRLPPESITTDVTEFRQALHEYEQTTDPQTQLLLLNRAIELYQGEFLTGYYEDWVLQKRQHLQEDFTHALIERITLSEQRRMWHQALEDIHTLLALDPLNEDSFLVLMRFYQSVGRPVEALRQYRLFAQKIKAEIGVSPSAELQHFVESFTATIPSYAASPPASVKRRYSNLTPPLTRLIGREAELADLKSLFCAPHPTTRLVTLLGAGGMGKTHLAQEFAYHQQHLFSERVWFVSLADLLNPLHIADTILQVMGIHLISGDDPLEQLIEFMQSLPAQPTQTMPSLLLVLDNFEHLVDGGTEILLRLLERVPHLACLVTSRQSLQLQGEYEFSLQPLPLPLSNASLTSLESNASVQLFLERGQSRHQRFALTEKNASAIIRICQKLDGIPLALELAAAWVRVLTPTHILEHLEEGIDLLTTVRNDIPTRQRSLFATQEWSLNLLSPDTQTLFFQLSIFRGGWTREAVQYVCNTTHTLQVLETLCSTSLILTEESEEGIRYRMLEPIRQYALQKLKESGIYADTARRHFVYFLQLASSRDRKNILPEYQNTINALDWSIYETSNRENCLNLYLELTYLWSGSGFWHAEQTFFQQISELVLPHLSPPQQAHFLITHSLFLIRQGYWLPAREILLESLRIWNIAEDSDLGAYRTSLFAYTYRQEGDLAEAKRLVHEVLPFFQRVTSDRGRLGGAYHDLALIHLGRGEIDEALRYVEKAHEVYAAVNHVGGVALCIGSQGEILRQKRDYEQARACLEESIERFTKHREMPRIVEMQMYLAHLTLDVGDLEKAEALFAECIPQLYTLGARRLLVVALGCMVRLLIAQEHNHRAAQVYGVLESLQDALHHSAMRRSHNEVLLAQLKSIVPEEQMRKAVQQGRNCPYSQILSLIFPS